MKISVCNALMAVDKYYILVFYNHLEAKIAAMLEEESIDLQEEDEADLSSIIQDVDKVVKERFEADSPQRIFWDQQTKYNSLKNKCQMRWHPLVIRFALNLKYLSTSWQPHWLCGSWQCQS